MACLMVSGKTNIKLGLNASSSRVLANARVRHTYRAIAWLML